MTLPSFSEFYKGLFGWSPFPWQSRLAEEVIERGWSGMLLDLPTGAGKTSALDVALYCLAYAPTRMPRRTLLVVDRRIVVDQGADHARMLRTKLLQAKDGPVRAVADALRALWSGSQEDPPFAVAVMRGGMPRDNDWARRPEQPVLGVSTVDQVGSRLLFRGYGISQKSASIHAGLIGNDTLVLLDEVHLAVPFAQTLDVVGSRFRRPVAGLPERFAVVKMSATARSSDSLTRPFRLEDEDERHPVLSTRLDARKEVRLVPIKVTGDDELKKRETVARRALGEALELQGAGARVVGIVVNRVDTARIVLELMSQDTSLQTDRLLVTGRMRPIDRDRIVRSKLLPGAGAGRTRDDRAGRLIVVATQCIEAGADLDFDGMVTECASLDALRQRFGRVDRRGELGQTRSVLLGRSDAVHPNADDPVYGRALAATWKWLQEQATDDVVDFGIRGLPAAVDGDGVPLDDVLAPVVDAPVMLPAHLDAWAHTSIKPSPDPDVAHWLHGPEKPAADVQIVWRAIDAVPSNAAEKGAAVRERILEQLSAVRPSNLEAITVPLMAARRWLEGDAPSAIADVVGGDAEGGQSDSRRRKRTSDAPHVLRWDGDDSEWIAPNDLKPGDVIVVGVERAGLSAFSFDPDGKVGVTDLGDLAQLRGRGVASVRLTTESLRVWDLPAAAREAMPTFSGEESLSEVLQAVRQWVDSFPQTPGEQFPGTPLEWGAALEAWRSRRLRVDRVGGVILVSAPVSKKHLSAELSELLTEDDDSSFRFAEVTLRAHSTDVRTLAEQYGRALGLGDSLVDDLALAGWIHDVGKADPRFQRWLVGGNEVRAAMQAEPLAKSALPPGSAMQRRLARRRAGYPTGYRHELLSLAMASGSDDLLRGAHDRDLVLHLVASHHGWCRPFAPPIDDAEDVPVALTHDKVALTASTRHRLARLDSGVVDRFWRVNDRYGWWGLAWLEAILRLADHRASEEATEAKR